MNRNTADSLLSSVDYSPLTACLQACVNNASTCSERLRLHAELLGELAKALAGDAEASSELIALHSQTLSLAQRFIHQDSALSFISDRVNARALPHFLSWEASMAGDLQQLEGRASQNDQAKIAEESKTLKRKVWQARQVALGVSEEFPEEGEEIQLLEADEGLANIPKDPISQEEIKEPVQSRACGHCYERSSIVCFIDSELRRSGRPPLCPHPGCRHRLELAKLEKAVALVRRIEKIKNKKNAGKRRDLDLTQGNSRSTQAEEAEDEEEETASPRKARRLAKQ